MRQQVGVKEEAKNEKNILICCRYQYTLIVYLYQRGLTREFSTLFKPTFYPYTVFRNHDHSQRVHSVAASPRSTALYTKER